MEWCLPLAEHGKTVQAKITCYCLSRERSGHGFAACGPMHQVRHDAKLEHNYFLMENLGLLVVWFSITRAE
jgi:hypothetical protein